MNILKKIGYAGLAAGPFLALAQEGSGDAVGPGDLGNVLSIAEGLQGIIDVLIIVAFALAILAFFYGVARYIFSADNDDAKKQGSRIMVGGLIGIFVITAVFGIVQFIGDAIGVDEGRDIDVVPGTGLIDSSNAEGVE